MVRGGVLVPSVLDGVDVEESFGGLEVELGQHQHYLDVFTSQWSPNRSDLNRSLTRATSEGKFIPHSVESSPQILLIHPKPASETTLFPSPARNKRKRKLTINLMQFDQLMRKRLRALEIRLPQIRRRGQLRPGELRQWVEKDAVDGSAYDVDSADEECEG